MRRTFGLASKPTYLIDYWKELNLTAYKHETVAERYKRKYIKRLANIWLKKEKVMAKQAKVLNSTEIRKVLDYCATRKHSQRNRALVLTMFNTGMRVSEVASLRIKDIVDNEGNIKNEIRLLAENTKTNEARTVFVNEKLRKELQQYAMLLAKDNPNNKFFYSQKRDSDGFTANTLTQHFHYLYKRVGLDGASSHSSRRTFITTLANKGIGVRVIMGLSGHKALSSVQCYIDCNSELMRNAVEGLVVT
jgi:integrase/recombinase XerD